jgi:two-component system, cell cycle response regulator DivK
MLNLNLSNKTILIVEDDDRCWFLLRELIEMSDGKAICAETGMEAIDIVTSKTDIDLVLMDMQLPIMDGIEATIRIREIRPDLPVIAQTAYSELNFLKRCIDAGCTSYILKPIEIQEFSQALKNVFGF